jgi:GntR family transcriptional regulator
MRLLSKPGASAGSNRPSLPTAIADELRRRVDVGELQPGDRLPSEPDLAVELGVSRPTLREALRQLAAEGWLERRHGSGTFIAQQVPVTTSLDVNFGVTELIRNAGRSPGTQHRSVRTEPASAGIAEALGMPLGADVIVLERLRLADREPVVHSLDVFAAGELTLAELRDPSFSVYAALATRGVFVMRGDANLHAVVADATLAKALKVKRGSPLMRIEQIDVDTNGRPVVYSLEHHRSDAFDFRITRRGPHVPT